MTADPLWDDLGYPKPEPDFAEAMRRLGESAREFSDASRKFMETYVDLPPSALQTDPAPDWR